MASACLDVSNLIIPEVNCYSHTQSRVITLHPVQWLMIKFLLRRIGGLPFRTTDEVIRWCVAWGLYALLAPQLPSAVALAEAKFNILEENRFERQKDCLADSVQKLLAAGEVDNAKRIVRISLDEYKRIQNPFWRERWLLTVEAAAEVLRSHGVAFDAGLPISGNESAS